MAIPPEDEDVALHTALLAKLAAAQRLALVSIGMSGDFETAIRFGATHVRVGTAIFGAGAAASLRPLAIAEGCGLVWRCGGRGNRTPRADFLFVFRNAHGRQNA